MFDAHQNISSHEARGSVRLNIKGSVGKRKGYVSHLPHVAFSDVQNQR
jgi:hypothetical protein